MRAPISCEGIRVDDVYILDEDTIFCSFEHDGYSYDMAFYLDEMRVSDTFDHNDWVIKRVLTVAMMVYSSEDRVV